MRKGTRKYKGEIPLKYFNYGKIGHFASKCPCGRCLDSDEEEEAPKKEKKNKKREIINKVKENSSRKVSIQKRTVLHPTKKVTIIAS